MRSTASKSGRSSPATSAITSASVASPSAAIALATVPTAAGWARRHRDNRAAAGEGRSAASSAAADATGRRPCPSIVLTSASSSIGSPPVRVWQVVANASSGGSPQRAAR